MNMERSTRKRYPEQLYYDEVESKILLGLCKSSLNRINTDEENAKTVEQQINKEKQVTLVCTDRLTLERLKKDLGKHISDIQENCMNASIAVQNDDEYIKVENYFKRHDDGGDIVYTVSQPNTAGKTKVFRLYSKDSKKAHDLRDKIERDVLKRSTSTENRTMKDSLIGGRKKEPTNREMRNSELEKEKEIGGTPTLAKDSSLKTKDIAKTSLTSADKANVKKGNQASVDSKDSKSTTDLIQTQTKMEKSAFSFKNAIEKTQGNSDNEEVQTPGTEISPHAQTFYRNAKGNIPQGKSLRRENMYDKKLELRGVTVRFVVFPITKISVDAIVNAANENLSHGAGVALAIKKEAGESLQKASTSLVKKKGKVRVTENVVTESFDLKNCRKVIHAVGPEWGEDKKKAECLMSLAQTVENVLTTAQRENFQTVAMPPISSGIFGYPKEACAAMYAKGIVDFMKNLPPNCKLQEFILVDLKEEILDLTYKYLEQCTTEKSSIDVQKVLKSLPPDKESSRATRQSNEAAAAKQTSFTKSRSADQRCVLLDERAGYTVYLVGGKVNVHLLTEDILKVNDVDILVSPENCSFTGDGFLAKTILSVAGKDYVRDHGKFAGKRSPYGEIKVTKAGKLRFKKVFHAAVSRFDERYRPNGLDLKKYRDLITNLLLRATALTSVKSRLRSIAMPLLGTGNIQDPDLLEEVGCYLFDGIFLYSQSRDSTIEDVFLVNKNEVTTKSLKCVFDMEARAKPPPNRHRTLRIEQTESHNITKKDQYQLAAVWKSETKSNDKVNLKEFAIKTGNLSIIDGDETDPNCVVCMDSMDEPINLKDCGHKFCRECIEDYFSRKPACPMCNTVYGKLYGDQPSSGVANLYLDKTSALPGYEGCETFVISYEFPDGKQSEIHPHPGMPYKGISRQAYIPNTQEGQRVLGLLEKAFKQRLIFTIGVSRTTGKENVLTWNDIHHKTRRDGGPQRFGYPDPEYLSRVTEELAAKGIR